MRIFLEALSSVAIYMMAVYLLVKRNHSYISNFVPTDAKEALKIDGKTFGIDFYLVGTVIMTLLTLLFGARGFFHSFIAALLSTLAVSWFDAIFISWILVGNNKALRLSNGVSISSGRNMFYIARGCYLSFISTVISIMVGVSGWIVSF